MITVMIIRTKQDAINLESCIDDNLHILNHLLLNIEKYKRLIKNRTSYQYNIFFFINTDSSPSLQTKMF